MGYGLHLPRTSQNGNQVHQDDPVNEVVRDAFGVQDDNFTAEVQGPEPVFFRNDAAWEFFSLMDESDRPLYQGCQKYSKLSFLIKLYHIKCMCGITDKAMSMFPGITSRCFPDADIPSSFYEAEREEAEEETCKDSKITTSTYNSNPVDLVPALLIMAALDFSCYYESCENYDVFISFRGSDIRHGFLSHMQNELARNNVDVYVDERMERGKEISTALKVAIGASAISLVIFSQGYASSTWCLEELVKIMECRKIHGQTVIPVFYNIDPSHVKRQLGTYSDAFAKHEENFQNTSEKLQSWRSALTKTATLSGYPYLSDNQ
ncbi:hypothetical protein K1719_044263 [Acacia pycnantha]|nr:hypothetical protein K1719_044263 [Acacia pycnantha]